MRKIIYSIIILAAFLYVSAGALDYKWVRISYTNFLSPFATHTEEGDNGYYSMPGSYSREYLNDDNAVSLEIRPYGNILMRIDYGKSIIMDHETGFTRVNVPYTVNMSGTLMGLHAGYSIVNLPDMNISVMGGYSSMSNEGTLTSSLEVASDYSTKQEYADLSVRIEKMLAGYGLGIEAGWIIWSKYNEDGSIYRYNEIEHWNITNRRGGGYSGKLYYVFALGPVDFNAGLSMLYTTFNHDYYAYDYDWMDNEFISQNGGEIFLWGPSLSIGYSL